MNQNELIARTVFLASRLIKSDRPSEVLWEEHKNDILSLLPKNKNNLIKSYYPNSVLRKGHVPSRQWDTDNIQKMYKDCTEPQKVILRTLVANNNEYKQRDFEEIFKKNNIPWKSLQSFSSVISGLSKRCVSTYKTPYLKEEYKKNNEWHIRLTDEAYPLVKRIIENA